jgi:hypothetical protein
MDVPLCTAARWAPAGTGRLYHDGQSIPRCMCDRILPAGYWTKLLHGRTYVDGIAV